MAFNTQTFTFARLLDHALRRCRVNPSVQTVEMVKAAMDGMFLAITGLANRGLNLWKLEHGYLGLKVGVNRYALPSNTIRLPNLNFVNNTVAEGVVAPIAGGYSFTLTASQNVARFGFMPTTFTAALTATGISGGVGVTSLSIASATYEEGNWYWFDFPRYGELDSITLTSATSFTLTDLTLSSYNYVLPMSQWNRDDWSQQPQKTQMGRPSTNFFFDRQIEPAIWIWPNVSTATDHIEYWAHREINQVTKLTDEVDIPTSWYNCVVWEIARELCVILPGVDAGVSEIVVSNANSALADAERGETDGSTLYLQPNLRGYMN